MTENEEICNFNVMIIFIEDKTYNLYNIRHGTICYFIVFGFENKLVYELT